MGMYTQARGWLNIASIGGDYEDALMTLETAKATYSHGRQWVKQDTILYEGSNGVLFLFFGTELKNYDEDAQTWIKHLITYFPTAEGRIDFQYEEVLIGEDTEYWLIYKGEVIKEGLNPCWCNGYRNS